MLGIVAKSGLSLGIEWLWVGLYESLELRRRAFRMVLECSESLKMGELERWVGRFFSGELDGL